MKTIYYVQVDLDGHMEYKYHETLQTKRGKMELWYDDKDEIISVVIANPIRIIEVKQ